MKSFLNKNNLTLSGFILLKFILQYLMVHPVYELHRDEYLHLDQAHHLAWGYLSVPPVNSWFAYLISLLGNSEFWVRFFPALFGALTILVVWKIIRSLGGNLFAQSLGAIAIIFSAIMRLNILFQPNSLDILCWTLFFFSFLKYLQTEKSNWLYISALVFAFGFLNKYNILFLVLGLFPALLLSEHRRIFSKKEFYLSVLIAFLIVLPNLIWQFQNDFPVFQHLRILASTQLDKVARMDFLKEQLLFFVGSFYVILAGLTSFFFYEKLKKFRLFFWSFVFTLLIFIYFRAKAYYAIGIYPFYIAFGSVYLEKLLSGIRLKYLKPVAILLPVVLFLPLLKIVFPTQPPEILQKQISPYRSLGILRWEDGKDHELPQDFADMLGWKELAKKVDQAYAKLPEDEKTLVICDNYGQAGAINYYSEYDNIHAVSMNADYINWFDFSEPFMNLIMVKDIWDKDSNRTREKAFFEKVELKDSITHRFAREKGTRVYVLTKAKIDIRPILKEEIAKKLSIDNN